MTQTISNFHQLTAAELAVDGQIEQSRIAMVLGQLQPHPFCPDVFWIEWSLTAHDTTVASGGAKGPNDQLVCCFQD